MLRIIVHGTRSINRGPESKPEKITLASKLIGMREPSHWLIKIRYILCIIPVNHTIEGERSKGSFLLNLFSIDVTFTCSDKKMSRRIPRTITISALRSLVGKMFGLRPTNVVLQLVEDQDGAISGSNALL